jgi:hypothetical protein
MATDIEINTKIETADSSKGLSELRKSLKELISLQQEVGKDSASFDKLRDAINKTEGKISDLNTSFQTLRGNGVDRLNNSISLLKEGFLNADPGKLSIAMDGLSSAMKAIPIFLLIEGAKFLFDNWKSLTDIFDSSAQAAKRTQRELEALTNTVNVQKTQTDALLVTKQQELLLLQKQEKSYSKVVDKLNEINNIKQEGLRRDLDLTDKQLQAQIDKIQELQNKFENRNLREIVFSAGVTQEEIDKEIKALADLQVKRGQISNQISQTEIDNTNKINDAKKESLKKELERLEKEKAAGSLRGAEFNRLLGLRKEYEEAVNAARIADEQAANQKIIDDYERSKEEERLINELFRQQEKEAEQLSEADRRLALENRLAFQKAFQQKSLEEKIEAIQKDRDAQLQNEQLTQDQRIKIIEDSENKIFQLKVQKAQEFINYAQQVAQIANGLNQLATQNENYELQQQQYAKDAAIQNDANRTQEQLEMEEMRKEQLLENDRLTANQRESITRSSENRKRAIEKSSAEYQDKLNKEFAQKELDIKKKQFEREKALQIATGIINTAASVLQTLASVPYPANIPLAVLTAAAGAVQVGIIASQKFDDGGAGANASVVPVSSASSSQEPISPNNLAVNPKIPDVTGNSVRQSDRAFSTTQKVVILESDITETSNRVQVFEDRRVFGD